MRQPNIAWCAVTACALVGVSGGKAAAAEWKEVKSGSVAMLKAVFLADKNAACAVGNKGTILASKDGGKTWETKQSPSDGTLRGLHFCDPANGFAVSDGDSDAPRAQGHILMGPGMKMTCGSVLTTKDGGQTWTRGPWIHTNFELRAIWMVTPQFGQICNHGGGGHPDGDTIVTRDGAKFSQRRVYRGLNDCFWLDAKTGWAVGSRVSVGFMPTPTEATYTRKAARIVATTDGGATWAPQDSPESGELLSVWFADKEHGIAVGSKGAIQRTADGGKTWANLSGGTQATLRGVVFADVKRGWAVGDQGTIIETDDAGAQWKAVSSPTKKDLFSVHASDGGKAALAVGADGTILRLE